MFERMLARRHIAALDLSAMRLSVRTRMGWTFEKTDEVELDYRRFLYALARNRTGFSISPPTQDVDEFWHEHILHTSRYREDCDKVFGRYIDHMPGLSAEDRFRAEARRKQVYEDDGIDTIYFDSRDDRDSGYGGDGGGDWSSSPETGGGTHHGHHAGEGSHDAGGHDASSGSSFSGDSDSSGDSGGDSGGDGGGGDGGGDGGGCGGGCGGGE